MSNGRITIGFSPLCSNQAEKERITSMLKEKSTMERPFTVTGFVWKCVEQCVGPDFENFDEFCDEYLYRD